MQLCLTSLWTSLTFLQLFLFEPVWPFSDYFSLNQSDLSPSISLSISLIFPQLFLFQPVWSFFCYFPLNQSDLSLVISLLTSLIFLQLFYRLFEPIDVSKIIQMVLVILCTVLRFIELRVMEIICLHYIPQFVILFTEKTHHYKWGNLRASFQSGIKMSIKAVGARVLNTDNKIFEHLHLQVKS